jgi:hypothetical protein
MNELVPQLLPIRKSLARQFDPVPPGHRCLRRSAAILVGQAAACDLVSSVKNAPKSDSLTMRSMNRRAVGGATPRPVPLKIGDTERGIVDAMSKKLLAEGMFFVSIDVIGEQGGGDRRGEPRRDAQRRKALRHRRLPNCHRSPGAPDRLEALSHSAIRELEPRPPLKRPSRRASRDLAGQPRHLRLLAVTETNSGRLPANSLAALGDSALALHVIQEAAVRFTSCPSRSPVSTGLARMNRDPHLCGRTPLMADHRQQGGIKIPVVARDCGGGDTRGTDQLRP